ncbi:MAG: hypothetical protein KatS3mg011_1072 [Acidimicrobiia bacterium]|nr:MAG: hypothetical protein KatS3mg011_1072 [Acidimicrobiia bacterium]
MRSRFVVTMAIVDVALLAAAVGVGSWWLFGTPLPWEAQPVGSRVLASLSFMVLSAVLMSFVTAVLNGPSIPRPSYGRAVAIVGGSFLLTAVLILASRVYFSRSLLAVSFVSWALGTVLHRAVRRALRPWRERIAVISREKELIDDLADTPHAEVVEVIDPQFDGEVTPLPTGTTIAVDLKAVLSGKVAQFVSSSAMAGYSVVPFTRVYEEHTGRVALVHLAEGWEISAPLLGTMPYLGGKRLFDLVFTIVFLPLWAPLAVVIAALVKATSPGPVIFRQTRVGKDGRPFIMYKFRTMRTDAERSGPKFASDRDQRLTAIGGFLRRFHLDEIPQLWNVLKGDMSLVGPRAEQLPFVEEFRRMIPFYDHRHLVRPGITGWAQVNHGYADDLLDTIEKLTYDLYYVKHMSPLLDLKILWRSVWTVLTAEGSR